MDEKEASGENRRRIGNRLKKNFFVLQDSLNLAPGEPEGNVKPKRLPNDTIIRKKTKKELPVVVEVDDDHIYDQKTKDKHDLIRNSSDAKQQNKNVDDTPKAEQMEEGVGVYMTKNTLALQDSRIHTNDIKNEVYSSDLYDCGIEKNTTETKLDEVCDTIEPIEIIPTSHSNGEVSFKNPTNLAPHGPGIDSFSNNTRRTLVSDENLDALSNSQNGIPEQLNRRLGSKVSSPKLSKIASQDEFKRVLRSKQSTDSAASIAITTITVIDNSKYIYHPGSRQT
ncbi:hypothetical protein AX774_g5711 [Zancudomyces culisetae]|uniref:Uncharacterized protein n=1 Tax=Zancudomyces culisetae TaxID=1213189 RepID=A0A1R1PIN3_ZANCU|nr:hypothetical protein AX774_g5711 [Zancudomyces culisetae]|eukprot:OMH80841.1 hypothetical protein AX774_g5711 [Zancudomyces culisetae]